MERRFEERLAELEAEAVVSPEVFAEVLPRVEKFLEPFVAKFKSEASRKLASQYVHGLLSGVERKNVESIAYHHDQHRMPLQKFIGQREWNHRHLLHELAEQVGQKLGESDAVIVFDPTSFPKKGTKSVGVARQWSGRLGKVDNCQVATFMAYVSRGGHALVNMRLYLSKEWAKDKTRRRMCGVPKEVKFQTRHEHALEMLAENGSQLPHAWIAGDDEMGKSAAFRGELRARGEHYVLAVPSNFTIRDLHATPPEPTSPRGALRKTPFMQVRKWAAAQAKSAWKTFNVRDGEKSPIVVEAISTRVISKFERRVCEAEETLLVLREKLSDGTWKYDYHLCHEPPNTKNAELVRVAKAEHRVEECFQQAKSEVGLAHYEVRTWEGWHHHITLALLASLFLTLETQGEKKIRTGDHRSASSPHHRRRAA